MKNSDTVWDGVTVLGSCSPPPTPPAEGDRLLFSALRWKKEGQNNVPNTCEQGKGTGLGFAEGLISLVVVTGDDEFNFFKLFGL